VTNRDRCCKESGSPLFPYIGDVTLLPAKEPCLSHAIIPSWRVEGDGYRAGNPVPAQKGVLVLRVGVKYWDGRG